MYYYRSEILPPFPARRKPWEPNELLTIGATVAPFALPSRMRDTLVRSSIGLPFTAVEPVVGTGVSQNFDRCKISVEGAHFDRFRLLALATAELLNGFLPKRVEFDDLLIQHYPVSGPGERYGISPHRDHKVVTGVVAIWLLEGESQFYVCADREGNQPHLITAAPGELILMRGYGYEGVTERPYHFVGSLVVPRLTFSLRETRGHLLP